MLLKLHQSPNLQLLGHREEARIQSLSVAVATLFADQLSTYF